MKIATIDVARAEWKGRLPAQNWLAVQLQLRSHLEL
jgi:hypothetical protein